ncbi:MAG TPA: hypothetical protein VFM88_09765 [Vicinamibacteria bacterium]|nr:hypothetical protein [Vicinamibacteria bacterium]
MTEEAFSDVVYRWHELMFRLDEMEETAASGVTEDEAQAFERERAEIQEELRGIEARLGEARVSTLRSGHEHDRAYAQQVRQIEDEEL